MKQNNEQYSAYDDDDEIDLRQLVITIWEGKWWIIFFTVLATLAAGLYAFTATPMYKVEAVVQLKNEDKTRGLTSQFGGLASIAGISVGDADSNRQFALKLLESRRLLQAFIEEENLLPRLYEERWDTNTQSWIPEPGSLSNQQPNAPTSWQAFGYFTQKIYSVTEDKRSGVITLTMTWHDPKEVTWWLDRLLKRFDTALTQNLIDEAQGNLRYLEGQLAAAHTAEVRQAVAGMMEFEMKKLMVASNLERGIITIIDPPIEPQSPFKPNKLRILALGILAGGFIGLVFVFTRSAFRSH